MTQVEIDQLSNQDLTELTKQLCQRVLSRRGIAMPLAILGKDQERIGFLIPAPPADPPSEEFLDELNRRIADPNATFLTVDEFFAALDAEPSAVAST
jgi:hypothetical protein